jgi:serine/threonine protein kinase/tetratricopeptide (TPR) repeat protein/WD40 repeat protein
MSDETLFHEARQKPTNERDAFLDEACVGDTALRERVEALLSAYDNPGGFLEKAALEFGATVDLSPAERPGTLIGPYKLLEQIGEGGMGVVYMADQQTPVRRRVALKIIKAGMDTRQVIARFEAERQALALMDHSNIARVFDAGSTDLGRPYFVMELVRGISITEYCDQNNLSVHERLALFVQVCHAVQHAHQKGIIHRDLKPSNVLVTVNDGRPIPKVIDFGVAKATNQQLTEKTLFTAFASMVGTPLYMSPEQAEMSSLDVDTRSDIYSLGVLLYELLTGTTPFDQTRLRAAAYAEMVRIIREEEPPRPSTRISTLGETRASTAAHRQIDPHRLSQLLKGDLDWIAMKSLEKDRTRRYETANDLAADILRHLNDQPVEACPPSAAYRIRKFVRRNRLKVVVAATVIISLIGGIAASTLGFVRATRAERAVLQQNDKLAEERDRAVNAESDAQQQKLNAERETQRAQLQSAQSIIGHGDGLTSAGEFRSAYAQYAKAELALKRLDSPLARLDLSLVRLYRESPPPLWTATLAGGDIRAWIVVTARNEIIAACGDDRFHVVNILTGESVRVFGDARGVRNIAVVSSPEGALLIASGIDFVRVIDPVSGAVLREAPDSRASQFCVVSPGGLIAASGGNRGIVSFWETTTLRTLGEGVHGTRPRGAAFSHDGHTVVTVSDEDTAVVWDPLTGKQLRTISLPQSLFVAFTADDRAFVCAELTGVIRIVSLEGSTLAKWTANGWGCASALNVTPEGNRIIVSTIDGRELVFDNSFSDGAWDLSLTLVSDLKNGIGATYVGETGGKACTATSSLSPADQGVLIAAASEGRLVAWPLVAANRLKDQFTNGMSMSNDGLVYAGTSNHIELRDTASGRILRFISPHNYSSVTAISPQARQLYAGTDDGTLSSYDLVNDRGEWCMATDDQQKLWSMDVSTDGAILATGFHNGQAKIWDAKTGQTIRTLRSQARDVRAVAFVPPVVTAVKAAGGAKPSLNSRELLTASGTYGVVTKSDLGSDSPQQLFGFPTGVRGLNFSPDRNTLAVSAVGSIFLLDGHTFATRATLGRIGSSVYEMQFIDPGSGLGKWGVSCGGAELRVWDLTTGSEELVLESIPHYVTKQFSGHIYDLNTLLATPDGKVIVAKGTGRINLKLPSQYRELQQNTSPVARAEWYAEWGLWTWSRQLLQRERSAGRDVPALLLARADWLCSDYEGAKRAFELAVARAEVPKWYADLCLSVGDIPPTITASPIQSSPESKDQLPANPLLPGGVLSAAEPDRLLAEIGNDVVADGVVVDSLWAELNGQMNIEFAGGNVYSLVCTIPHRRRQAFDAAFGGDVANTLRGSEIRVHGKLGQYYGVNTDIKGCPQMQLDEPSQITIIQPHPVHGELPIPITIAGKRSIDEKQSLDRALASQRADRNEDAVVEFTKVIELQPDRAEVWRGRGESFRRLNEFAKMAADYSEAIKLQPKMQWYWHERAYAYLMLGEHKQAISDFSMAIELGDQDSGQRLRRGISYEELGELQKAADDFSRAIEIEPLLAEAWSRRGETYRRMNDFAKMAHDNSEAIKIKPETQWYWHERGYAYFMLGERKKAIADYSKSIGLRDEEVEQRIKRGDCYFAIGEFREAEADYSRAIELDPASYSSWFSRFQVNEKLGQSDKARSDLARAVKLCARPDDQNTLAWRLIVNPDLTLRDPKAAVELVEKATAAEPEAGKCWNTLGVAQYRAGNWRSVVTALSKSMELRHGGDSSDWFFLAMAHWQLKEKKDARIWYDKAIAWMDKNEPKNDQLLRFRNEANELLKPGSTGKPN